MAIKFNCNAPSLKRGKQETKRAHFLRVTLFVLALIAASIGAAILGNAFKNINKRVGLGFVIGGTTMIAASPCLRLNNTKTAIIYPEEVRRKSFKTKEKPSSDSNFAHSDPDQDNFRDLPVQPAEKVQAFVLTTKQTFFYEYREPPFATGTWIRF